MAPTPQQVRTEKTHGAVGVRLGSLEVAEREVRCEGEAFNFRLVEERLYPRRPLVVQVGST